MEQILQDEQLAIRAIYQVDFEDEGLEIETNYGIFLLKLILPREYPFCPPKFNLKAPSIYNTTQKQRNAEKMINMTIQTGLDEIFVPGQPVLYDFIDFCGDYLDSLELETDEEQINAPEQQLSEPTALPITNGAELPHIFHSQEPAILKKSSFVAHLARVDSIDQIELVKRSLATNSHYFKATHNISAHRIMGANGILMQDCDDDGEKAAGSRLLSLLQLENVLNIYCVVSRRFGGIQLGPIRFKLINNTARQLMVEEGCIKSNKQ